ncbi:MAG TPA: hypothetical protein VF587_16875 [Solirubrobacteraceae bacterium]|jgi:hypothetical protein
MSATDPPPPHQGLDRRDLLRLGGLIAVLLLIVGVVLLAGGGGDDAGKASSGQVVGVLTEVSQARIVVQPTAGGEPEAFEVRPQDAQQMDFFHLEQHASDALPSIVHYDEVGGKRYATRVDDAPAPVG